MKGLMVLATMTLATTAFAERFTGSNHPNNFNAVANRPMTHKMAELPLKAKLKDETLGWSDTFWPSNMGGIAYRWNHPDPQPFKFKFHTKEEILKMSEEEISQLSPAELYDIAMGDYRFNLTKKVLKTYSPRDLWWEGICHGWAQAASNYSEPLPVVITNPDGVKVPFGSSDVKGLLSMHDSFNSKGMYVRVGDRCSVRGKVAGEELPEDGDIGVPAPHLANKPACRDVNAGAFHIVLASMIGVNSQGFVADVDRFNDVWNQPIKAYESDVVESVEVTAQEAKSGIVQKLRVKTRMIYGEELEFYSPELEEEGSTAFVSKDPVTGTPMAAESSRDYEYVLELDAKGDIIGGEWITESRPDMLWMKKPDAQFRNGRFPLAGLNQIYKPLKL